MKKGLKKGAMVSGWRWYMPERVCGRVIAYLGRNLWAVQGKFGLEEFHGSSLRLVRPQSAKI